MRAVLEAPQEFNFRHTITGHGWGLLAPFRYEEKTGAIGTTVNLPGGRITALRISPNAGGALLEAPGRSSRALLAVARRMLGLDLDFSDFHRCVGENPDWAWMAEEGVGRLLRCPTMWEDVVKLILTTNCSWAFTTKMCAALVDLYGEEAPDGTRAFPTPRALARVGEKKLRGRVRAGYRAPLLAALARKVAGGEIDLESWDRDERDPADLRREMLTLPGVGPYVAENLLRFLGRPAGLGLDSWLRARYAGMFHKGRRVTDRTIARRYARLGRWAGLALWFEMTRDWLE